MRACLHLALAALACRPSVDEPIVRLATCGADGPVRLLDTAPDSTLTPVAWGDRLIVYEYRAQDGDYLGAWSVGLCGESPTFLGTEFPLHIVGDQLFTCSPDGDHTEDIFSVDPEGLAAPRVLFVNVACQPDVTEHGWVAYNEASGVLLLHRDPRQPSVDAEVLATGIVAYAPRSFFRVGRYFGPVAHGPHAYAIDLNGDLLRIELDGGAASAVASDAEWAWLSPDGATLWWKEAVPGMPSQLAPVHVRTLANGTDRVAYHGRPPHCFAWPYALAELDGSGLDSIVDLRDGSIFALEPHVSQLGHVVGPPELVWVHGGDHWIVQAIDETNHRLVEVASVLHCTGAFYGDDGLAITQPQDCSGDPADLWWHPYDGGEPQLLARDVGPNAAVVGERVVWSHGARYSGEEFVDVGDLFVTDGDGERIRLDDHAYLHSEIVDGLDGDVIYSVHDGERSGLWRTATR